MCIHQYIYIYIYIHPHNTHMQKCMYMYVYVYIYIYILFLEKGRLEHGPHYNMDIQVYNVYIIQLYHTCIQSQNTYIQICNSCMCTIC